MFPTLQSDTLAEIQALACDLEAYLKRHPKATETPFDPRRLALYQKHLGRALPPPPRPLACIGDSHTMFFAGAENLKFLRYRRSGLLRPQWINRGLDLLPCFRVFHLGPATAWKAGDPGSSTRAKEKFDIILKKDLRPATTVMLCFGEIDCRVHMPRAVLAGRSIDQAARDTAVKFCRFAQLIAARGMKPVVWGPAQIVPEDESQGPTTFPFVGPWELRRDVTVAYTAQLRCQCEEAGIPMVSILGLYEDVSRKTPADYFIDGAHLSQRVMPLALAELKKAGIL